MNLELKRTYYYSWSLVPNFLFIPVFLFSFLISSHSYGSVPYDSSAYLRQYEDSLKDMQYLRIRSRTDKEKEEANARFTLLMTNALHLPGSFDYPFDSLVTIARLYSPDKQFRIINWNVPVSSGKELYFGFIQSYNPKKKKYELFVLIDKSNEIPNPQTASCNPDKWLGMVYYKIIKEGKDKNYILLGKQFYSKLTNRKIIDVISFNNQGVPVFGKALFAKLPSSYKSSPKRLIFEYSAQVSMSLRFDESKKIILFDHLGPTEPELTGQYQYYGPSFQIDGLEFKNGTWKYIENVDARNAHGNSDKLFRTPVTPR